MNASLEICKTALKQYGKCNKKYNVAPRLAAYMVALERLVIETTLRGYNC